jgi:site-specific recombinase XerC
MRSEEPAIPAKSLQTLLGHSSLTTTDRYIHADAAHVAQMALLASLKPKVTRGDSRQGGPPVTTRI